MKILGFPTLKSIETINFWSKRKLSEVSKFSISGIEQNKKLGNLGNFHFFVLITYEICSSFLSFFWDLVLGFNILPKIEAKENIPRFLFLFRFWVLGKIQNLQTYKPRKFSFVLINPYHKVTVFYSSLTSFFGFCILGFTYYQEKESTFEVNEFFPRFPSFRFQVQSNIESSETSEIFIFSH